MKRRSVLKNITALLLSTGGLLQGFKLFGKSVQDVPLYSPSRKMGNLIFTAGKIANFEGDIGIHTKYVLDELEKELEKADSSMDKVLKTTVYLINKDDFAAMNAIYKGRFGKIPPARTTVVVKELVGATRIEIDCIAYV